jgi:hypothetical protein
VDLEMIVQGDIDRSDEDRFEIKATGVDLSSLQNPLTVSLLIGANYGTATIQSPRHYNSGKDEDNGQW